jgi:hypothetical protein
MRCTVKAPVTGSLEIEVLFPERTPDPAAAQAAFLLLIASYLFDGFARPMHAQGWQAKLQMPARCLTRRALRCYGDLSGFSAPPRGHASTAV